MESNLPAKPIDDDTGGVDARLTSADGGDENSKTPRLPRWTRQEILVLIQGKRVAESKSRSRIRASGSGIGSGQIEPKWASVSSYCRMHGVNRGPVQCRKRWSNLAGDYKKIKEWESQRKEGSESFWVMRNDLRRERKLPGFFDKEVYDILDGGSGPDPTLTLADTELPPTATATATATEEEKEDTEDTGGLFGSRREMTADDGLCSEFEPAESGRSPVNEATVKGGPANAIPATPISVVRGCQAQGSQGNDKQPSADPEIGSTSQGMRKRQRLTDEDDNTSLQSRLIDVLERNGKVLATHLEAQNIHLKLDREQRKEQADSLVTVLNKLADAMVRIAEKL